MSRYLRALVLISLIAHPAIAGGIGRVATPEEIEAWDIDIRPDGIGLPEGQEQLLRVNLFMKPSVLLVTVILVKV